MSMSFRAAYRLTEERFYIDEMTPYEVGHQVKFLMEQDHKPHCRTHLAKSMPNYGSDCTCGQWALRDMIAAHWDEGPDAVARYLNGEIDWTEAR